MDIKMLKFVCFAAPWTSLKFATGACDRYRLQGDTGLWRLMRGEGFGL